MVVVVELTAKACASVANAGTAAVTNAVVATAVVSLPGVCVGAVGVPVRAALLKPVKAVVWVVPLPKTMLVG
jgi:hypothetical protein